MREIKFRGRDFIYLSDIMNAFKENDLDTLKCWIENEDALEEFIENHQDFKYLDDDDLIEYFKEQGYTVCPVKSEEKKELNATFFKSDAKKHIEINGHNLNKNPHTYAFSVYRMPKMERLFDILNSIGENNDKN